MTMAKKAQRIHRPQAQTPEQEAAELTIRQRFLHEKPSLQDLVARGDIGQVFAMGEYWELCKTFAGLKALRQQQGLSISDLAERTGMDRAMISRLENGQIDNPTIATVSRYAKALGKRAIVSLVDAKEAGGSHGGSGH
jgi:ribosome-binding protein aMBF1 (putative translation factor)